MNQTNSTSLDNYITVINSKSHSPLVVVCEHASCFIPAEFENLGLTGDALQSHAAWDPGALPVARGLAERLDGSLVAAGVSRLVYDCNRPPSALDAMPMQSETISVPGNFDLTREQRQARTDMYYEPFRSTLAAVVGSIAMPVIVTIHSFTPIYHGKERAVEIGVLHDRDTRLANAMLETSATYSEALVLRNEPYGPEHGVTHTLKEHALEAGHLNVMLEIRNDLIKTVEQQDEMAASLATWLSDALVRLDVKGGI